MPLGSRLVRLGFGLALVLSASPSKAADESVDDASDDRTDVFTIAPYFWLPDISGSVALGSISVPVDLTGTNILGDVNAGGLAYVRWHRGDHFFYADATIVDYEDPRSPLFFEQQADAAVIVVEGGGGMVEKIDLSDGLVLEVLPYFGFRYTNVDATVTGAFGQLGASANWLDPVAGVVLELPVADNVRLISKLDGAGFNITNNEYYSALGVVDYQFAPRWTVSGGYRWSHGRYRSNGGLNVRLTGHGPLVGITYTVPLP